MYYTKNATFSQGGDSVPCVTYEISYPILITIEVSTGPYTQNRYERIEVPNSAVCGVLECYGPDFPSVLAPVIPQNYSYVAGRDSTIHRYPVIWADPLNRPRPETIAYSTVDGTEIAKLYRLTRKTCSGFASVARLWVENAYTFTTTSEAQVIQMFLAHSKKCITSRREELERSQRRAAKLSANDK
jgi:hypothetical protein